MSDTLELTSSLSLSSLWQLPTYPVHWEPLQFTTAAENGNSFLRGLWRWISLSVLISQINSELSSTIARRHLCIKNLVNFWCKEVLDKRAVEIGPATRMHITFTLKNAFVVVLTKFKLSAPWLVLISLNSVQNTHCSITLLGPKLVHSCVESGMTKVTSALILKILPLSPNGRITKCQITVYNPAIKKV